MNNTKKKNAYGGGRQQELVAHGGTHQVKSMQPPQVNIKKR